MFNDVEEKKPNEQVVHEIYDLQRFCLTPNLNFGGLFRPPCHVRERHRRPRSAAGLSWTALRVEWASDKSNVSQVKKIDGIDDIGPKPLFNPFTVGVIQPGNRCTFRVVFAMVNNLCYYFVNVPRQALGGGIPSPHLEPLVRFWRRFSPNPGTVL